MSGYKPLLRFLILVSVHLRYQISLSMNTIRNVISNFQGFSPKQVKDGITCWTLARFSIFKADYNEARPTKYVYMDLFPIAEWLAVNSAIADYIVRNTPSEVRIFNFMAPNRAARQITKLYGLNRFEIIKLKPAQYVQLTDIFLRLMKEIKNSRDLFELEIQGVRIGIDIYESVLRSGLPTVKVNSFEVRKKIYLALRQFVFFLEKFESGQIHSFVLSHDSYIGPGLCSRMAHRFEVPVIQANIFEINILQKPFQNYERFLRYREYFNSLSDEVRTNATLIGKENINRRFAGEVNIERDGRLVSSLNSNRKLPRQIAESQRIKILVLTHDFFDNPHAYSLLPFLDFMEWLEFLAEVADTTDYDWYIKCHPDSSGNEFRIIKDFIGRHSSFKLVDSLTSLQQLSEEGLNFATTCYGTVGSELPLLGVSVINASYNPHISYTFNTHASDLDDYRKLLSNLGDFQHPNVSVEEICEFAFVHRIMMSPDDFSMPSVSEYLARTESDPLSPYAQSFIWAVKDLIAHKIQQEFQDALTASRTFSVEKCLSPERQSKISRSGNYEAFFEAFNLKE